MILSLDTETTGVDRYHGAVPYLVTTCTGEGVQTFWEWDVNPLDRTVSAPPEDLEEIQSLIDAADTLVLQNPKFDVGMLQVLFQGKLRWDWGKVEDTLIASHVLASNRPHDLTALAVQYLGADIQPYEDAVGAVTNEARRLARRDFPTWRIAKKDLPEMPSAKEKTWKYDMWLPRALAKEIGYADDHPWWTVCSEYANADSAVTAALFPEMKKLLERRSLWRIYKERLKVLPIALGMENRGITLGEHKLKTIRAEYVSESERAERLCVGIARGMGYELTLPKSGNNKSLGAFLFGEYCSETGKELTNPVLNLPVLKTSDKTGAPSLDKGVLEEYEAILPANSKALLFVKSLKGKRKRDTAIAYMDGYVRFWIPVPGTIDPETGAGWYRLHPSLNPTGTDTLRWSCSNPNEQNISKQEGFNLRRAFGPAPGREWWSCDAKNIELRLPFYESKETALMALFEAPDDPPYYGSNHLANFHAVYPEIWEKELRGVGIEKVGPHCKKKYAASYYQWCKNGGFAKQYGGQRRKVDATFHRDGAFDLLDAKFSKLAELNKYQIKFANKHGYVETIPDKTADPERGYPLLCTRTERGSILETVPLSYHVQGSAMWWTMKSMIRCEPQLEEWRRKGFDGYLIMQVHDELVFDFPKRADPVKNPKASNLGRIRVLQKLMEEGGNDFGIPTPVGIEYHSDNWGEGVTM